MNSIILYIPAIKNKKKEIEQLRSFFTISKQNIIDNTAYISDEFHSTNIDITDKKIEFFFPESFGSTIIDLINKYLNTYYQNIIIGLKVYGKIEYYNMIESDKYRIIKY